MRVSWSKKAGENASRTASYILRNNVNWQNKIIYYIENDTVNIVAFWDTRREPKTLIKDSENLGEE